jgi:orotidine-5'-phosphate decarboxylase
MPNTGIVVALVGDLEDSKTVIKVLKDESCDFIVDIGHIIAGNQKELIDFAFEIGSPDIILDPKLNDTPSAVEAAAEEASDIKADCLTIHASCGIPAMAQANDKFTGDVWATLVLSSLEENEAGLIFGAPRKRKALQFARDAMSAGLEIMVCTAKEIEFLKSRPEVEQKKDCYGNDTEFICVGIKPNWYEDDDIPDGVTPAEAVFAGADKIIVCVPIAEADDPEKAFNMIENEIEAAEEAMDEDLEYMDLHGIDVPEEILKKLPIEFCIEQDVILIKLEGNKLTFASDLDKYGDLDEIKSMTDVEEVKNVISPLYQIREMLKDKGFVLNHNKIECKICISSWKVSAVIREVFRRVMEEEAAAKKQQELEAENATQKSSAEDKEKKESKELSEPSSIGARTDS